LKQLKQLWLYYNKCISTGYSTEDQMKNMTREITAICSTYITFADCKELYKNEQEKQAFLEESVSKMVESCQVKK
jgi:hypothetical protein